MKERPEAQARTQARRARQVEMGSPKRQGSKADLAGFGTTEQQLQPGEVGIAKHEGEAEEVAAEVSRQTTPRKGGVATKTEVATRQANLQAWARLRRTPRPPPSSLRSEDGVGVEGGGARRTQRPRGV